MLISPLVFRQGLNIPHELTPLISSPHAHPYCPRVFGWVSVCVGVCMPAVVRAQPTGKA